MIHFFKDATLGLVGLIWGAIVAVVFQWLVLPEFSEAFTEKWLWSLHPARDFPIWFRLLFPAFLLFFPFPAAAEMWKKTGPLYRNPALFVGLLCVASSILFWIGRVGDLVLGDSQLILNHFVSLTTYASIREPLESILHTEWSKILFFKFGVHPLDSFQALSCLWGFLAVLVTGAVLSGFKDADRTLVGWTAFLFLVGPVHLFFGYVEWYTQLAAGLILFQIFALKQWMRGEGLWAALGCLLFAINSHLVAAAFLPAAYFLIATHREKGKRLRVSATFTLLLVLSLVATTLWIRRHIVLGSSVQATANLFSTLLPLIREGDPSNPPGSWTYAWLSANHIGDLLNELILCAFFPLAVLTGIYLVRRRQVDDLNREGGFLVRVVSRPLAVFFGLELFACLMFLLIWNPWLGFPADWDLFSFFAWPLLAASLSLAAVSLPADVRNRVLSVAAIPAFSIIFSWVVFYGGLSVPTLADLRRAEDRMDPAALLEEARFATKTGNWPNAFETVERVLRENPDLKSDCLDVFSAASINAMSFEWPREEKLIPLAVDFEIIAASPMQRALALDCWGRVFFWEGGYFNDWSPGGLPGIPEHRAVDMEIVPWKKAAIVLRDDGELFEIPIGSWVLPNPKEPRETVFVDPPLDRTPKGIGNLYTDYAKTKLGRGHHAVDLTVDHWNRRLIALDTTGNLVSDTSGEAYAVTQKEALLRCDAEVNFNGATVFTIDRLGMANAWPGRESPVQVLLNHGWPSIVDMELGRAGGDVYVLDGQGGVTDFSNISKTPIQPSRMTHYAPTGERLDGTPYVTDPIVFFIDLEIVPGEKAYFRMTKNFRIHYAEDLNPDDADL